MCNTCPSSSSSSSSCSLSPSPFCIFSTANCCSSLLFYAVISAVFSRPFRENRSTPLSRLIQPRRGDVDAAPRRDIDFRPRYCLSIQCRRPSLPPSSVGGRWRLTFLNVSRASPPLEDYPQQLIDAKQRGKREGREARSLSGSSPPWCRFSEIEDR